MRYAHVFAKKISPLAYKCLMMMKQLEDPLINLNSLTLYMLKDIPNPFGTQSENMDFTLLNISLCCSGKHLKWWI